MLDVETQAALSEKTVPEPPIPHALKKIFSQRNR